jgi:hypothetical protein
MKHGSHHKQGARQPHEVIESLNEQARIKAQLAHQEGRVQERVELRDFPQRKRDKLVLK